MYVPLTQPKTFLNTDVRKPNKKIRKNEAPHDLRQSRSCNRTSSHSALNIEWPGLNGERKMYEFNTYAEMSTSSGSQKRSLMNF